MRFWDTSALVPLIAREASTEAVLALHREDPVVLVAWTASIECVSAFVRKHRERAISDDQLMSLLATLGELARTWNVGEPTSEVRAAAERLVEAHGLRAADAIQLASARAPGRAIDFVCFDRRLARAATAEGHRVVPRLPG
jgi:predicted nucleic acid-binding protein